MADLPRSAFVISLDLELFWGMRDVTTIERYGNNIKGVRIALPAMLEAFSNHGIEATFAAVGLMLFGNKEELLTALPGTRPTYAHPHLSPYHGHIDTIGRDEASDPYHFGTSLIRLIQQHPEHELACHTFAHYYCLSPGQTAAQFEADLVAAQAAASRLDIHFESFVFPKNQYNPDYLAICGKHGITAYRGNNASRLYKADRAARWPWRRAWRLLDSWYNISGTNAHPFPKPGGTLPIDLPASRFLRPWNKRTAWLDDRRFKRITNGMDHAARKGMMYHLWWHPHNFGANLEQNMAFLERILEHYEHLRDKYGMRSMTMKGVAKAVLSEHAE